MLRYPLAIQQVAAYVRSQGAVTEAALAALAQQLEPALGTLTRQERTEEELGTWLQAHGLAEQLPRLAGAVERLEDVSELGDADLEALGMPLATRRRVLRAAATLDEYLQDRSVAGSSGTSSLATVWARHLDALRAKSPAALDLLVLLQFLAPDDVDSAWLPELAAARGAGPLHAYYADGDATQRTADLLSLLADHSLADRGQVGPLFLVFFPYVSFCLFSQDGHFSVHRMVLQVVQQVERPDRQAAITAVARWLAPK